MAKTHFLNIDKAEIEAMKNIIEKVDSAENQATKIDHANGLIDSLMDSLSVEECKTFGRELQERISNKIEEKIEAKVQASTKKISSIQDLIATMNRIRELHELLNIQIAYDPRIGGVPNYSGEERRQMMHEFEILNKQVEEINGKNGF